MLHRDAALLKAREAASRGDWDTVIEECRAVYEITEDVALETRDLMTDRARYEFPLTMYDHHGDGVPVILDMVREAGRYKGASVKFRLPDGQRNADEIEVYRGTLAGALPTYGAGEALSWTIDHRVACFFAWRAWEISGNARAMAESGLGFYDYADSLGNCVVPVVLSARIATNDVIGYLSERNESEVLQFESVRDVHVDWCPDESATEFEESFMDEVRDYKRSTS